MSSVNRLYKDRLFIAIFGTDENKDYALSLYNAVNETEYSDKTDLEICTIGDAVYMGMKNDVSYIFDESLSLYEQQSTYNPNMPLRGLFYFSRQYEKYIGGVNQLLYKSKLIKLPTPKYVVFYNGDVEMHDREVLKLSDAFINLNYDDEYIPSVEVKALMLNINKGKNSALLERCYALKDYSNFVANVKIGKEEGLSNEDAVDKAVEIAVRDNYLDGWFRKHKAEVKGMILSEYDEKATMQMFYEDGKEDGIAEGKAEGKAEGIAEVLQKLGITKEQYEALLKKDLTLEELVNAKA